MYSATFAFAKGDYDDEFHRRDQAIAEIAKASVLAGSTLAAILGAAIMLIGPGNSHEQVTPG